MTFRPLLAAYDRALGTNSGTSLFTEGEWGRMLSARLPVSSLAAGSVAALAAAVDRFSMAAGMSTGPWHLSPERITASFSGDRMMRIAGAPVVGFAELSGFFPCADGWIRTHANYPHHRSALTAALDLDPDVSPSSFADRVAASTGSDIENRCCSHSAIAVYVRSEAQWKSEAGMVTDADPLIHTVHRSDHVAFDLRAAPTCAVPRKEGPLRGVRVLDFTRVIAGPVATRVLALLGATVLRVDSPRLPEIEWQHLENGQGKRTTLLDLDSGEGVDALHELLPLADVVVTGYRPGALNALRTALEDAVSPGIIHASVSAWGPGPWYQRRGFDSIVQAATGIASIEGTAERPGALPAQVLDHSTGYLLAAAIVDGLAAREPGSAGLDVSVSLARTAAWLLAADGRSPNPVSAELPPVTTTSLHGTIRAARPALAEYQDYAAPSRPWGRDEPSLL
ncbi:CoA transferase [Rhodococcus sp. G-MC3]|uniref:CoA transferase n=1 Tax=Rhodococcus sp. G-MC3 TaxID=3046209 RepID=UPI0024BB494F|nr:CoA transferase [Rhodococcus sp. G-MC3]MDJ0394946.1 CoA transferase [Rhodococcus sp. G-MC3]